MVDYDEFNRALDSLMRGENGFDEPTVQTMAMTDGAQGNTERAERRGTGRLIVQVSTAGRALPIEGARVTITDADGNVIAEQTTNSSGRTEAVELEVPSSQYSQQPGNIVPYSVFNVKVERGGYYDEQFLNIAVFDKIDSIQPVSLIPLGEDSTPGEGTVIDEESGNGRPNR